MRNLVKEFCASSCSTALEMEERRRCTTVRQLEVMLEFLEGHRDLALGRVRSKEARAVAQRLWQECAELLNGLGPARTAKEWSKVWNDQKTKVRAKLLKINASQRATGGGPSNAPTLTPLEDKVANIIGRDVGPLPNVAQDHFAVNEGDTLNESEHIIAQEITVDSDNIEEMLVEGGNISPLVLNMEAAEHEDEVEVPLHQPVLQEQIEPLQSQLEPLATPTAARARRTREHRRSVHASRAPTAQLSVLHQTTPAPQVQSARSALEESRKMIIKIEELKAQTALENAQAANKNAQAAHETAVAINTLSQSFKLIAESIDRMSRQYCASQQIHQQPE